MIETLVMLTRLHAIVEGHVQGVGYRMFVVEEARRLDINGWVRNRSDDSVEITAEGERDDLEQLVYLLREGPHLGTVSHIKATYSSASGEFKQFWVLETW